MDDLSFRKALLAEPKAKDDAIQAGIEEDAAKKAFADDVRNLDKRIHAAADIPVPDDLAQRLILRQSMHSYQQQKVRSRWHLAVAASVAFVIGIALNNYWINPQISMGDQALAHVYEDLDYTHHTDEQVQLDNINAKLARFGGEFSDSIGKVFSANYCFLKSTRSLHLVMDGEMGRISVFVVPHNETMTFNEKFSDSRFIGQSVKGKTADLVIIGEKGEPLEKTTKKLTKRIQWSA